MFYCTRVAPTASATDDADGTPANVTMSPVARRILYVGGYVVDATHTAAEGRHTSAIITGDVNRGGADSRIPLGTSRSASMVGGDSLSGSWAGSWYPVDWTVSPNAIVTGNVRGIGGTVADEVDIFLWHSDGEGHPAMSPILHGKGLSGVPKYYIRSDLTAISNSTTETGGNAVTRPGNASLCIGVAGLAVPDGTIVAAEEMNTRMRLTSSGHKASPQFEPDQIWPVNGGAHDAGLQGLANASVDFEAFEVEFIPLKFPLTTGGTITPNWTMRSALTNAVEHYFYAAFV